jgi:hypothetical protein
MLRWVNQTRLPGNPFCLDEIVVGSKRERDQRAFLWLGANQVARREQRGRLSGSWQVCELGVLVS